MSTNGGPRAQTLAFLRQKIVSGEWPVNSRIPTEPALMELLGVSRTTVREAVRTLAGLGMLESMVSRGTYVRSRTPVSAVLSDFVAGFELEDILGFRRALEVEAAQAAALHRTDRQLVALRAALDSDAARDEREPLPVERGTTPGQFHALVHEATGNRLMAGIYAGVMAGLRAGLRRADVVHGAPAHVRAADHAAIYDAIEAQDVAAAAHAMAAHVDRDLVLPRPASDAT